MNAILSWNLSQTRSQNHIVDHRILNMSSDELLGALEKELKSKVNIIGGTSIFYSCDTKMEPKTIIMKD
jgi:hypothetical protein